MKLDDTAMTLREAYVQASSFLARQGIRDHDFVSELLLRYCLGVDRSGLYLRWNEPFPEDRLEAWHELLQRKAAGEPAQYLIGEQEFYGLPFAVTSAVLIPRPETEILVEQVIALGKERWMQEGGCNASPAAADVGTGSGAIAVTLAVHCPSWNVYASDISPAALEVARGNAVRNGVGNEITLMQGDLLEPYIQAGAAPDILVSNPPYIASAEIETLQPEVRQFEPRLALDGGADGLVLYRRMAEQLKRLPVSPRIVGLETGMGQAADVADLLRGLGCWNEIRIVKDLAGIDRHVIAVRD